MVLWPNEKHYILHKLKSMFQHQPFHLAVVNAAPVRPGQETPANFHLALQAIIAMKPGRSNHLAILQITGTQRSSGVHRLPKKRPKHLRLIAITVRMLLPKQRITSHSIQLSIILNPQRPKLQQLSPQNRLTIKRHCELTTYDSE